MTPVPAVTDRTGASDQEFADRVAAIEAAPAAPESFDPIAALRRVEALAEELGFLVSDETVDQIARVSHAWTAHRIRAALAGDR